MNASKTPYAFTTILLFIALAFCSSAQASVTAEVADKALSRFNALPRPGKSSTEFAHWTYNTALIVVSQCAREAYADDKMAINKTNPARAEAQKQLRKAGITRAGVFSSHSQETEDKLCQSIAEKGLEPHCPYAETLWAEPMKTRPGPLLPRDYLQVASASAPLNIRGGFGCFLTKDELGKQFFSETLNARWILPPRLQSFNLANGPIDLVAGTIMVTSTSAPGYDGKLFSTPRIAIVVDR